MQISQPCSKIFYERPTILRSLSAFDFKVNLVQKKFSLNFHYRRVARGFDNPAEEKLPESREKFYQCPKINNKLTIFRKTSIWESFLKTYNSVLLTPLEKLLHKTEKFLLDVLRCYFFKKNTLVTTLFQRTLGIQISQTRRKKFDRKSSAQ